MLKPAVTADGGRTMPSGNLSFAKRTLAEWTSGAELTVRIASAIWGEREVILTEHLMNRGRRDMSVLNYTLRFAWQLGKSTESVSGTAPLRRHGCPLKSSLDWPAEHQSSSVTRGWLQTAPKSPTTRFPASTKFETNLPVNGPDIMHYIDCFILNIGSTDIPQIRNAPHTTHGALSFTATVPQRGSTYFCPTQPYRNLNRSNITLLLSIESNVYLRVRKVQTYRQTDRHSTW